MRECYEYAIEHVCRFPKTTKILRKFLIKKWYDELLVDETVNRLIALWFVDDSSYAELYISSECEKKWKSFFHIRQKLLQKWIDSEIIDEIYLQREEEIVNAMKKTISHSLQTFLKRDIWRSKAIQKLCVKGYPYELVLAIIDGEPFIDSFIWK